MELDKLLKLVKKHEDRLNNEIKRVSEFLEQLKKRQQTRTEAVIERTEKYLTDLKTLKQNNKKNYNDLEQLIKKEELEL